GRLAGGRVEPDFDRRAAGQGAARLARSRSPRRFSEDDGRVLVAVPDRRRRTRAAPPPARPRPAPLMATMTLREEATDLLQRLIRLDTVNPPGNETAAAELLRDYLA